MNDKDDGERVKDSMLSMWLNDDDDDEDDDFWVLSNLEISDAHF